MMLIFYVLVMNINNKEIIGDIQIVDSLIALSTNSHDFVIQFYDANVIIAIFM